MQIKTTTTYHLTWFRMVIIYESTKNKYWLGCGERGTPVHCGWKCKWVQPLWKTVWDFLKELTFDLVSPLLRLYPKNPETPIQKNLYTPIFTASLFTIAKWWKLPGLSVDEWIKKLWYIYTMEYYAAHGTPTLCNSMDGTGEHYAKWNRPGGERQIPYNLTYKWNLMNKTNKWAN